MMNLIQTIAAAVGHVVGNMRTPDKCPPRPVLSEYTDLPLGEIDNIRLLRTVELDLRNRLNKKKFLRSGLDHLRMQLDAITERLSLLTAVVEQTFGETKAEVRLCEMIISNPEAYAPDVVGEAEEDIVWLYEQLDRLNAAVPYPEDSPPKIYEDRWRVDWGFDGPH